MLESKRFNHSTLPSTSVNAAIGMLAVALFLFACLGLEALL
jgi:hypothetical protein